jgi:hypothetical protein
MPCDSFQDQRGITEIILEINDLQKGFLDNQPLAQTMLYVNDLHDSASARPKATSGRGGQANGLISHRFKSG